MSFVRFILTVMALLCVPLIGEVILDLPYVVNVLALMAVVVVMRIFSN